jgi:type I restriction enzyme M protein
MLEHFLRRITVALVDQAALPGLQDQKSAIRAIRNYLAGQALGITRDEGLLEEVLKCAFCRVQIERAGEAAQVGHGAEEVARTYCRVFRQIRDRFSNLFAEDQELLLGPEPIAYIDATLAQLNPLDPARDLIGDIYEAFIGTGYRGQEGQFFTPKNAVRSLVAMVGPQAEDTVIDPACGAGGFLLEAVRAMGTTPENLSNRVFGVDKDKYLAHLARLHLAIQFGAEFAVECADSLSWNGNGLENSGIRGMKGHFSVVLTNPPFGSRIVALKGDARSEFQLARKWRVSRADGQYFPMQEYALNTPPQVLFIERCLSLLREGGRLGIVVPESTLSNTGYRHVVQYVLEHATPLAIIGMPEALFKTSGKGGTHTKVCLVVLRKGRAPEPHQVFMAEAKWCGHDSRGQAIPKDDLPTIVERYLRYQQGITLEPNRTGFLVPLDEIRDLVLAPRFYDPEPIQAMRSLRETHDFYKIGDLVASGLLSITTGDELGKLAYGSGDIPFVRTSDLSNWEIKVDPKHAVDEALYRRLARKQDVREGDILMVKDGTYLIGTCAMVSRYDMRIVFQSHLYKIRVAPGAPFDNFLLLAALSSAPVVAQIRAMSFTQDIIDSLGERIRNIVVPVPKDRKERERISKMVKQVVEDRVEARELARRARVEIVGRWGHSGSAQPLPP